MLSSILTKIYSNVLFGWTSVNAGTTDRKAAEDQNNPHVNI